jgi:hypothetical protein
MANRKRRPSGRNTPRPATRRPPGATIRTGATNRTGATSRTSAPTNERRTAAGESTLRTWVAKRSTGVVVVLSRQPRLVLPAMILVLMLVGLFAPVILAVIALAVILAFVSWLAFLSWPVLPTSQRGLRLLLIGLILVVVVARITGWF